MPLPAEQESNPTSIIASLAERQAQRSPSSTANIPSKKEKRNAAAKDNNSSIVAAINMTSRSSSAKPPSPPISTVSPPADAKATSATVNGTKITSPLLGALSANMLSHSPSQTTTEWARNVPLYSGSPSNLISLGDSPPTVPSSYDDKSTLAGWSQRDRTLVNERLPSTSPPSYHRRPLSFQLEGLHNFDDQLSQRAPAMHHRRSSVYSQHPRFNSNPPLPHQPQAHFFSAPELNLGLPQRASGILPGMHGYYCGFDSIGAETLLGSKDNVVLSGYEGGLEVYAVTKTALGKIASLEGLSGGIYAAKILPWTVEKDPGHDYPLVAVVQHGPVLDTVDIVDNPPHGKFPPSEAGLSNRNESARSSPRIPMAPRDQNNTSITHFQTTVEIYSLRSKKHIATLLRLPKIQLIAPITNQLFVRPQPSGSLTIQADAGNLAVTSGTTGEVWIYRQDMSGFGSDSSFRCVGKFWTTVPQSPFYDPSGHIDFTEAEAPFSDTRGVSRPKLPLLSLKGRWLAYCPSVAASQIPLGATVPTLNAASRVPGLNTYGPPQMPTVNCTVDTPDGEEFWGRIRRQAAQGTIKGAEWVKGQGVKVWNNYWNKPISPLPGGQGHWPNEQSHDFPPTHGASFQNSSSMQAEPMLISIVDLEKLGSLRNASNYGSAILATFKAPFGCSFMSFAPSGLALFTASSKGDVQVVWDLMRIQYTKSSALQPQSSANSHGLHVRQVAAFTRLTVARIVDVVWTLPHGDHIAMVTERNTIHFLDLPPTAFNWPPARRRPKSAASPASSVSNVETPSSAAAIAAATASNAVGAAWRVTQPFLSRPRGFSGPGRPSTITASLTATAGQGGKALASGISKSFGAATGTIQHFRKAGENKLHLSQSSTISSLGCVKWLGGHNKESFAALVDGSVKIYTIKWIRSKSKPDKYHVHIGTKNVDHKLPLLPDYTIAPAAMRAVELEVELGGSSERDGEGLGWVPRYTSAVKVDDFPGTESSIPQAEIESNAPYQPFHTDHRVGLFIFSKRPQQLPSPSVSALLSPSTVSDHDITGTHTDSNWVFGLPVHAMKLDVGVPTEDDEMDANQDHRALPPFAIEREVTRISEPDDQAEQIVVTTRRRKSSSRGPVDGLGDDEEGFFEDDCEVLDFASNRV